MVALHQKVRLPSERPETLGLDAAKLELACQIIGNHIRDGFHPGAQLAVARYGKLALYRCFGRATTEPDHPTGEDTLFLLYSNTKVVTAAAIWTLVEEGRLRFSDRVAQHIPEFEAHGKGDITVADLLTHRAGFPTAEVHATSLVDHVQLRQTVCDFRPEWPAGSRLSYHRTAAHWVLAVLIEALTARDYREEVNARVIKPLGLDDEMYLGLPEAEFSRAATLYLPRESGRWAPSEPEATTIFKRAGVPGGGGYATARAMVTFYQMMSQGGELDGTRVVSPRMIDYVTRDFTGEMVDEYMGIPMHRGLGPFSRGEGTTGSGLGSIAHPRTFGHSGVGTSFCWADPISGVSFAFLSNCRRDNAWHNARMDMLSTLVHASILR